MSYGSGLAAQLGAAAETTYGTRVAPTRFYEFLSATPQRTDTWTGMQGIGAGRLVQRMPASRRPRTLFNGTLGLSLEVLTTRFGLLLSHIVGGTEPTPTGVGPAKTQTHQLGEARGRSLSCQLGIPQTNGTVQPFDVLGAKVTQASFTCEVGGLLQCDLQLDGREIVETNAIATPSLPAASAPFHFAQSTFKVGGSPVDGIRSVTATVNRSLAVDRHYVGAGGKKAEPIENGYAEASFSLGTDFLTRAAFLDAFAAGTPLSVVWEFVGAQIETGINETFRVTAPQVFVEGQTPGVSGPEVVAPAVALRAYAPDDATPAVTVDYISTDTTV